LAAEHQVYRTGRSQHG